MRFVTYDGGRGARAGVLRRDAVVDVWDALGESADGPGLDVLLATDRVEDAADLEGDDLPLSDVRLLPPLPRLGKIVCIGLNYRSHAEESGMDPPETPTFFAKWANALAAPAAEVELPEYSDKVDYEAEVAFAIGRRCRNVPEAEALDVVAGYTLLNDLSARDHQFMTPQWMPGKVFDGSAPCGPALVTPDEAGHPAGVGSLRQPRVWLRPGDEVVVSSPTLGRLETRLG